MRYMPNAGRSSRSPAARSSSAGTQSVSRKALTRTCGLGHPPGWIGPKTSAILGNSEIEARIRIWNGFRVTVDKREIEAVLALEAPRCRQLLLGIVDSDYARAATCEPRRYIGRAASQLNHILTCEVVRKHANFRLRHAP